MTTSARPAALVSPYATFTTPELQDHARTTRMLLDLHTGADADRASLGYLLSTYEAELAERALLREAADLLVASGADLGGIDAAPRLSRPRDDDPGDLAETDLPADAATLRRLIVAERRTRIAEWQRRTAAERDRDEARDEAQRIREENTLLVNAVCNPNLDGLGTAAIRTVMYVAHERRMGRARDDGSVRAPSRKIGDDWRPDADATPILPASTTHAHTKRLAALGLLDRRIEPDTVRRPTRVKGADGKWIAQRGDDGKVEYANDVAEVTFLNLPGETVAEMLEPFAFFADRPEKAKRGGDRRSATFRAMRAAVRQDSECPHCHEKGALTLTCHACGCRITDHDLEHAAEEAEIGEAATDRAIKLETHGDGEIPGVDPDACPAAPHPASQPHRAFQIGTPNVTRGGTPSRARHHAFRFETHGGGAFASPPPGAD